MPIFFLPSNAHLHCCGPDQVSPVFKMSFNYLSWLITFPHYKFNMKHQNCLMTPNVLCQLVRSAILCPSKVLIPLFSVDSATLSMSKSLEYIVSPLGPACEFPLLKDGSLSQFYVNKIFIFCSLFKMTAVQRFALALWLLLYH